MANRQSGRRKKLRLRWLVAISLVLAVAFLGLLTWLIIKEVNRQEDQLLGTNGLPAEQPSPDNLEGEPQLTTEVVLDGRENIWDVAFLPSGEMLFTERRGTVSLYTNNESRQVAEIEDIYAQGEGGLLGLAVDPEFTDNRYIYTCFNSNQDGPDVRVVRWKLSDDLTGLEDRNDIVTGMPSNTSGRHSGCRLAFGVDGYLWIGTGDAAQGANPQDPHSLGGKILRVDRNGNPPERGNLDGDFDPRIYSYGHRNVQGLAMLLSPRNGIYGVSIEHGTGKDDEINLLEPGNFGWDPVPSYNESVAMTDTVKFPDSIPAIWSSGDPTVAPSGATFVYGEEWRDWSGALVVAILKDRRLKVFELSDNLQVENERDLFVGQFGRLRAAVYGPDGNLYVTTDNAEDDKIIRIIPN
jgi:aldose sugar dehydrogenase